MLREPDEPDWGNPDKVYSSGALREMERIERNQATVIVFPVWWWSMPAVLKGLEQWLGLRGDEITRTNAFG